METGTVLFYLINMKQLVFNIIVFVCLGAFFSAPVKAQLATITITETQSMNFGTIIADTVASTVRLRTNGQVDTTQATIANGGDSLAEFDLTGEPKTAFTISYSTGDVISGAGQDMTIGNFEDNRNGSASFKGNGAQTLKVGGTLFINNNQLGGSYSGTYTLIIEYQ
jgi:hypothetical protein